MEALVDAGADASIQCVDPPGYIHDRGLLKLTSSSTALEAFCTRGSLCINQDSDDESDPAQFQRGFTLLLRAGADVNAKAVNGIAPLHLTHSLEVFKLLLQAGTDPNAETEKGETVLHCFPFGRDDDHSCLKLLMERGADLNRRERSTGKTPLLTAIKTNFHLALDMLEYNPDCTTTDSDGNGPLHQALMAREKDQLQTLLSALISNGADPNVRNRNGETPLHVLACYLSSFTSAIPWILILMKNLFVFLSVTVQKLMPAIRMAVPLCSESLAAPPDKTSAHKCKFSIQHLPIWMSLIIWVGLFSTSCLDHF